MPIYCFDTSAINQLHDEPDRQALVKGLLAANKFRLTAINVIEALGTKDVLRRRSLLRLMAELTDEDRPLTVPNELLIITAVAYHKKEARPTISITSEQDGLWTVLQRPELADDDRAREETLRWVKSLEKPANESHQHARGDFQRIFCEGEEPRPLSAVELIRRYLEREDFVYEVVAPLYEYATGACLVRAELRSFFREIPHWPLYLVGWAYSIYSRAVQLQNHSEKKNAGVIDLWCAIYLPHCDYFVTHDRRQLDALRIANVFNWGRCTRITSYAQFRKRLLIG
jgi:hypothetical protein